jgi:glycosyltransferase involved in cell wall biosynthesis
VSAEATPLVSVGLPTYNGVKGLARAIESVLSQTHEHLELVISDNASTDETPEICREAAARDARVRHIRQPDLQDVTANFNSAIHACRGEYMMLLADDDWISPAYIQRCLAALRTVPGAALANGSVVTVQDGEVVMERPPARALHQSGARRVIDFYSRRHAKSDFYGLRPRLLHARTGPLLNFYGNDEIYVASLAFLGRLVHVPDVCYYRSPGGMSAEAASLASAMKLPGFHGRHPFATFTWYAASDILWRSPAYRTLSPPARLAVAVAGLSIYLDRRFGWRRFGRPVLRAVLSRVRQRRQELSRRLRRGRRRAWRRLRRRVRRHPVVRAARLVVRPLVSRGGEREP